MSVIDYFRHNAQYWVNRINTEGKLSKSEVKLAIEFVTSAFKWECFSSADRVAKELQNKGYAVYNKDIKERNFKTTTVEELIKDNSMVCINYIKTFTPEIIYDEEYVIIYYTRENGERFEKKIKRQNKITIQFLEKAFEEVKEEARIWLMQQQSEVQN